MANVSGQNTSRRLLINLATIAVFVSLMLAFIVYFYQNEPDAKRTTLKVLISQFSVSVTNAHWQWQAEGRPQLIMLVHYESNPGSQGELVEKDRRPVAINSQGWPKIQNSSAGCGKLWRMILNLPLDIQGFKVYAEYFSATPSQGAKCRYRLSTGPYFEYFPQSGKVSTLME